MREKSGGWALRRRACAAGMALWLAACAEGPVQADDGAAADAAALRRANCFRIATIDHWRVIDSHQLIVYGPRRRDAYHVRLLHGCHGLRMTETVGFRARGTSRICGEAGDQLIVPEGRCAIRSVRAISPAEQKILLDRDVRDDIGKLPPADADDAGDDGD